MTRTLMVAGNWKLHHGPQDTRRFIQLLNADLRHTSSVQVVVAPPFTSLAAAHEALQGSDIALAAQNCWHEDKGAFTGEVAPSMLREIGVRYVILGHSERRQLFLEADDLINKKLKAALAANLQPIFCIGETLQEREEGRTQAVVAQQVRLGLQGLAADELRSLVLAYEPVWAIGTGKTASPAQAQEVHAAIRKLLRDLHGDDLAQRTRILYGGSVKADNAEALFSQEDIDGGLVGGASLKADSFVPIVRAALLASRA